VAGAAAGSASAHDRFAIVVGRFYADLAERLVTSATRVFEAHAGPGSVDVFDVPGAFELPLAAQTAVQSGRYAGVACLGAVIRGETTHYDYVCNESARGIMDVSLRTGVPCSFGVVTVENMEQALARTGGGKRDQGAHAAEAVLALVRVRTQVG
jgi:6,7-dimethyl-8-ribityllumazine synthase